MIFIHGGDFGYGGTSISYYDGTNIVRDNEDVIVVTLNYRLNFFGFPNAPGLEPSRQNLGLQDQRLAIEWVYENIAHFGGDPERMILFGQSVGAASADIYAHAYPENPLVKGIIMQSGTYMSGPILRYQTNWERLSNAVGCGFGEDSINCMKKVPLYKIVDAMAVGEYSFLPVPDGSTYFADYKARAKSGKIAKLPVLAGFDEKELAFMYPLSMNTINESEVQADTQASFNCPLLDELRLRSKNDIPIWRYVYQGNFSNLSPRPWLGAYHTSEIPLVFGTYNVTTPYSQPASRLEIETSRYMQGAWVAFAKDPQSGLQKYGWPQFNDKFQEDSLVKIGGEGISSAVLTSNVWDQYCNPPLL
ncbi:Carboxylesterase type B [Penicillium citrinum]|uniref:Carboxylesterase type B n=1 Tax=Penicillium citrinum TaxID=5077 RepID=A0A9W9NY47_PENCI|nr:Carboxylesterase type B [Penicillium citrinum]KAJ5231761.1 Carboxylesterase type B [Penicillium citrinum]